MPTSGLIITADDYGLNKSCNAGIRKAVKKGVVTSVHIMMNLATTTDIKMLIQTIKESGNKCGIGLHFNTTFGKSIIQEEAIFKYKYK